MAKDKYYINCTYKDKDEAKLLGARWDPDVRKWYIPMGLDRSKFRKWTPKSSTSSFLKVIKWVTMSMITKK